MKPAVPDSPDPLIGAPPERGRAVAAWPPRQQDNAQMIMRLGCARRCPAPPVTDLLA